MKIAVIIPAYNEAESIARVVSEVLETAGNTGINLVPVVVNDCSRDETLKVAGGLSCIVLDLSINLGIGGAVQTGFQYASTHGFDYAVQLDGDGQHPAGLIPLLASSMQETGADVVIGSRFLERKGYQSSFSRRQGIRYFQQLIHLLAGIKITDPTSGFRMFGKKAIALCAAEYPDDYPEPEAILTFHKHGLSIREAPVAMRGRLGGKSSISHSGSVYYMLKVTLALLFTYIRLKRKRSGIWTGSRS